MAQPNHISKLGPPDRLAQNGDLRQVFVKSVDKLDYVSNLPAAYSLPSQRLGNFMPIYNEIMMSSSGHSKLEAGMTMVIGRLLALGNGSVP